MKNTEDLILLLGIFGFSLALAVDIELSKEGKCLSPPPQSVKFNASAFLDKSITLFTPLTSKYVIYRSAEDLYGKEQLKNITEEEINNSCLTFSGNDSSFCVRGFDELEICYEFNPESKDSLKWRAYGNEEWDESWVTKASEDYFVAVDCWSTDQKSFAVNSLKNTLDPKEMADIVEHLQSLGFKSEYFLELKYDGCKP